MLVWVGWLSWNLNLVSGGTVVYNNQTYQELSRFWRFPYWLLGDAKHICILSFSFALLEVHLLCLSLPFVFPFLERFSLPFGFLDLLRGSLDLGYGLLQDTFDSICVVRFGHILLDQLSCLLQLQNPLLLEFLQPFDLPLLSFLLFLLPFLLPYFKL